MKAELWKLTNGDAHLCAPLADLLVVHAVDGAVFPFRRRGGEWGAVGVAGGGVEGEDLPARAAIHLDFALVEVGAVALPAPVEFHFVACEADFQHGLEGGEVGGGLACADDAEVLADGIRVGVAGFDVGHGVEDAGEGSGWTGDDGGLTSGSGRQGGWGKEWEHEGGGSAAALGLLSSGGAGFLPIPHGGQPGAECIDEPTGVGDGGVTLGDGDAERGGVPGELVAEVFQPEDLIGDTNGVVGLAGHRRFLLGGGCWRE